MLMEIDQKSIEIIDEKSMEELTKNPWKSKNGN
jgi:hypothetical protein